MKKLLYTFSLMFVMVFASITLSACGKGNPKSIAIKENSISTNVLVNEEFDTSNLVLLVKYENGSIEEIAKNDEMEISSISTNVIGTQTLTIKYLGLSTSVKINVVAREEDVYTILGFETPLFYTTYKNNLKPVEDNPTTDFDETEEEFVVRTNTYKIGDDNAFQFLPIITMINQNGEDFIATAYTSKVKVEMWQNSEYVELTGEDLTNKVAVDNLNSTFDFTEQAIGNKFRIQVEPMFAEDVSPLTFECEVVDGWNAYTTADLSRIDNNTATASVWAELKAENNIGNEQINGIVLHNNMQITKDDIPKGYLFNQGDADTNSNNINTLRDWKSLYTRDIKEYETFSIYGNYFTINASQVPLVYLEEENASSHSALISFGGDNDYAPSTQQGVANIDSLKIIGNARRQENLDARGGMMGIITKAKEFNLENSNIRAFLTIIDALNSVNPDIPNVNTYKNSKMFDTFSCMFYLWSARDNNIINCVLKGSGGPIIIATHVNPEKNKDSYSNVKIVDSEISAPVTGTEAWFAYNKATAIATLIKSFNKAFVDDSTTLFNKGEIENVKSFMNNDEKIEFLCGVFANNPLTNSAELFGKVEIVENDKTIDILNMQNPIIKAILTLKPEAKALPFFESNGVLMTVNITGMTGEGESQIPTFDGLMYVDPTDTENPLKPLKYYDGFNDEAKQNVQKFFNGECLNLFYNGNALGAVLKFYNA